MSPLHRYPGGVCGPTIGGGGIVGNTPGSPGARARRRRRRDVGDQPSRPAHLLLSRVVLLVAVLTGMGGMHVLDAASGHAHGAMPVAAAAPAPAAAGAAT